MTRRKTERCCSVFRDVNNTTLLFGLFRIFVDDALKNVWVLFIRLNFQTFFSFGCRSSAWQYQDIPLELQEEIEQFIAEGTTFSQRDQTKNELRYRLMLWGNSNVTIMWHWQLKNKFSLHTHLPEALQKPFHIVRHLEKHLLVPLKVVLLSEIFLGKWYCWDCLVDNYTQHALLSEELQFSYISEFLLVWSQKDYATSIWLAAWWYNLSWMHVVFCNE